MDKICSKCGETKDISLFAKDRHSSDGYTCWCKDYRNKVNENTEKKILIKFGNIMKGEKIKEKSIIIFQKIKKNFESIILKNV